ncbi:MAG: hypothetical protein CLLPBCKN_007658 [Chroococcidiopsis cubana SAG 39.79]|uniref:Uncharacterized protein n=1 Tax=Chroococcidiopsis cubana SAG 39.79 TaxID=388085 RepID=A0AB37UTB7_9CYAN|nr:hypothetical protein [Chroococcidiopsis cubana SAG 39.79]RUT14519.1 hypothetical protein DSM107010_00650 [Chroococcidiopsis cubana SAG 39.79]
MKLTEIVFGAAIGSFDHSIGRSMLKQIDYQSQIYPSRTAYGFLDTKPELVEQSEFVVVKNLPNFFNYA